MEMLSLLLVGVGLLVPHDPALGNNDGIKNDQKTDVIEVKVLVLNFDPIVHGKTKTRLHEVGHWRDPRELAKGYIEDVQAASHGLVRFKIVEWLDLDEFTILTDGFVYSLQEYERCRKANKGWHEPGMSDYPKMIAKHKLVERVEKGEIDEVWWFGGPYFGFFESAMAGEGAFYINGGVFGPDQVKSKRAFAIMGFNYERGVAEMVHDLSHRTESTMARVFGGWKVEQLDNDWSRFAATAKQSGGQAGVGNCHFPPNGQADYDYANKRFVESTADDWLNYPKLTGVKQKVNCETWGGPDYHRNYMKWWFTRLPHAPGINPQTGRLNNWWEYVFHYDKYDEKGKARKEPPPKRVSDKRSG
jgi:hypothetical protein